MPWREMSPMEQRADFVREFESGLFTMTELAAQYGISRKTGYKWVAALRGTRPGGLAGSIATAASQSPRDRRGGGRRDPRHPPPASALGAEEVAGRRPAPPRTAAAWPARSTIAALLKRRGLVPPRRRRRRPAAATASARGAITRPNEVWTVDYKGEFLTGDRRYCYPFTLRDGFSRYVLRCDALTAHTLAVTRPRFERAFAEYGLPDRIRSDNGPPFGGPGLGRLSTLAVWWIRLGIVPERIDPGHPEQNGSHEQFHKVLKAETARPPASSAAAHNSAASPASAPSTTRTGRTKA